MLGKNLWFPEQWLGTADVKASSDIIWELGDIYRQSPVKTQPVKPQSR